MFKVEIKDLGEKKANICETLENLDYKNLVKIVSPYLNSTHLSFSIPNDSFDGTQWGYIYAGESHVGQIKITEYNTV